MSKNNTEPMSSELYGKTFKVNTPDFEKLGYKVTVLKPQSRASEQFERDKFCDERPELFRTPDSEFVERCMQADYDGNGYLSLENIGDNGEQVRETENKIDFDLFISKLPEEDKKIAKMVSDGCTRREIMKELKVGQHKIERIIKRLQ